MAILTTRSKHGLELIPPYIPEQDVRVLSKSYSHYRRIAEVYQIPESGLPKYVILHMVSTAWPPLLFDKRYGHSDNVVELFRKYPELVRELKDAIDQGDFSIIIRTKILLDSKAVPQRQNGDVRDVDPFWLAERQTTRKAWKVDYIGNHHTLLLRAIDQMTADIQEVRSIDKLVYWNHVPIIQSSGMGKSRTVDELAKRVFTIPFNFREGMRTEGYPPNDMVVRKAFLADRGSYAEVRLAYACILAAIFNAVRVHVETSEPGEWPTTHDSFARKWYELLRPLPDKDRYVLRDELYEKAMDGIKEVIDSELRFLHERTSEAMEMRATHILVTAADALNKVIPDRSTSAYAEKVTAPVKIILSFDECHVLTEEKTKDDATRKVAQYRLGALVSSVDDLQDHKVFGILMSTSSRLASFAIPSTKSKSYEGELSFVAKHLQAPFVEFPFDQWKGEAIIVEDTLTKSEVNEIGFLCRFGRPLWWTRYESHPPGLHYRHQAFKFAAQKLCCQNPLSDSFGYNPGVALAVLSARLALELDYARQEARRHGAEQVASHMRLAYSVPAHREYVRSGSSSEPVLAEAAAEIWNNYYKEFNHLDELEKVIQGPLLATGDHRELVTSYMLLRAYDICCRKTPVRVGYAKYSQAIPLWDFLQALFNETHRVSIGNAKPRNRKTGKTLKQACEDFYVRLSHFARAGDSSIFSASAAWRAFARAHGWQCLERQGSVDIAVPIFYEDPSKDRVHVGRHFMSYVFIQVKKSPQTESFTAEKLGVFDDHIKGCERKLPYFVFVLHLSVLPPESQDEGSFEGPPITPQRVAVSKYGELTEPEETAGKKYAEQADRGYNEEKPAVHVDNPCYWIEITGCSPNVYNPVIICDTHRFRNLLASRPILDEHPRQEEAFIQKVLEMKPYFTKGKSSYGWARDSSSSNLIEVAEAVEVTESIEIFEALEGEMVHDVDPNAG